MYTHTITPIEAACGVTLEQVADELPKVLMINAGRAVMVPVHMSPALSGSIARCALAGPVTFSHLSNGYPIYEVVTA